MFSETLPDLLHTVKSEILLPESLHGFMTAARKNTWASGERPIEIPGRIGYKRLEYHENGTNIHYEDEFYDDPEIPGVFSGREIVKTLGRGGRIFVVYTYSGELTEQGLEMGEDVVYPKLQYFLREQADKARFGQTFDVEHRDDGIWAYTTLGETGRSIWKDNESLWFSEEMVYRLNGAGAIFFP